MISARRGIAVVFSSLTESPVCYLANADSASVITLAAAN